MITATSEEARWLTRVSDGVHAIAADTTPDKGGAAAGLRPHDLLEAALAACTNMTVRFVAAEHGLPLTGVETRVTLDRSDPERAVFRYEVALEGPLDAAARARLLAAAERCPVRQTLGRKLEFVREA